MLLEGEPGVGKTDGSQGSRARLDTPLIRLQCYEGLTASEALYEWNYQRQLLRIRLAESRDAGIATPTCSPRHFLQERPILQAFDYRGPLPPVLLIDEIDRADDDSRRCCSSSSARPR